MPGGANAGAAAMPLLPGCIRNGFAPWSFMAGGFCKVIEPS